MSPAELQTFLERTNRGLLGVVGTLREDGSPHVVPVWYRWDGEAVRIWSDEGRGWVRDLLRDRRVAFSVQEIEPPYAAVVMHGQAEVTTSGAAEIVDEIRMITCRYIEETQVDDYIARWDRVRTLVTIRPEAVSSWTVGY